MTLGEIDYLYAQGFGAIVVRFIEMPSHNVNICILIDISHMLSQSFYKWAFRLTHVLFATLITDEAIYNVI